MQQCKLCGETNAKLENSHIIPDAFWRKTKNNGKYISISDAGNRFRQETYTERLLCKNCEQRFSVFEDYAVKLCLQNPGNIGVTVTKAKNSKILSGVKYAELKLFQMSIVWRASISTAAFYERIKLSPQEEERFRCNLLTLNPFLDFEYGCLMSPLCVDNDPTSTRELKGGIVTPTVQGNGANRFLVFIFGGFEWRFFNPRCADAQIREQLVISHNGRLRCNLKNMHDDPLLFSAACHGFRNQEEGRSVVTGSSTS